jgi:hypothetical protein
VGPKPTAVGVDLGKLAIKRGQHLVDDAPDQPQRMLRRNAVLKVNIRKQLATPLIRSAHPCLPFGKKHRNHIREGLTRVIGHADRAKPLRDYCVGLMIRLARSSIPFFSSSLSPIPIWNVPDTIVMYSDVGV